MRLVTALCLAILPAVVLVAPAAAQYHSGHYGYGGYRGYYSYPSYYQPGYTYYQPSYYQPGYCPAPAPSAKVAAAGDLDQAIKTLLLKKLLEDQGGKDKPAAKPDPVPTGGGAALTAEELAQLRLLIQAIREQKKEK